MTPEPITADEMAGLLRRTVNTALAPKSQIADPPVGAVFEMAAPATGQRFRVTVEEVPSWTDGMDRELAQVAGNGARE